MTQRRQARVARQASLSDRPATSARVAAAHGVLRAADLSQVRTACLLRFRDEDARTSEEWGRLEPRVVVIADTFTREEVNQTLLRGLQLRTELIEALDRLEVPPGAGGLEVFELALAGPLSSPGITRLAEIEKPLRAALIAAPEMVSTDS